MLEFMQRKKVSRVTNEKITEILDRCNGRFGWVQIHMDTEENYLLMPLADLVDLLEKQIPKKPVVSDDGWQIACPNCSATLIYCFHTSEIDCCDRCGQRLDWEGIE